MKRYDDFTRLDRIHPKLCLGNLNTAKASARREAKGEEGPKRNYLCVNSDAEGCRYLDSGYRIERLTTPVDGKAGDAKGARFEGKCDIYIRDSTQNSPQDILDFTRRGAEAIHRFLTDEATKDLDVLVHCYAGMNRSVSTILRYAMDYRGWRFREALDYVRRKNTIDRDIRCDKTGSNWMFMRVLEVYDAACRDEDEALRLYERRHGCCRRDPHSVLASGPDFF